MRPLTSSFYFHVISMVLPSSAAFCVHNRTLVVVDLLLYLVRFMTFFNMSCLGVILQAVMACLHCRMAWLHTHSITYHVVSRCLPCGFRPPECPSPAVGPPNCRGFRLTSLSLASSQLLANELIN